MLVCLNFWYNYITVFGYYSLYTCTCNYSTEMSPTYRVFCNCMVRVIIIWEYNSCDRSSNDTIHVAVLKSIVYLMWGVYNRLIKMFLGCATNWAERPTRHSFTTAVSKHMQQICYKFDQKCSLACSSSDFKLSAISTFTVRVNWRSFLHARITKSTSSCSTIYASSLHCLP